MAVAKNLLFWGLCLILLCVSISADADFPNKRRKVKCMSKDYPLCFLLPLFCPWECPQNCDVDCVACKPVCGCNKPGAVCQDPRFVGGDGITFYFHGKKDKDFCIVSDHNLHINAHFIGKTKPAIKRDFTWVQSIAILFDDHRVLVGAMKTAAWEDDVDRLALAFDGVPVVLPCSGGAEWQASTAPGLVLSRPRDLNSVTVELAGNFRISATVVPITETESRIHGYGITGDDCFAHLDLSFKFYSLSDEVTGVLGQTYAKNYISRAKLGVANPVLGGDREFSCSGLFAVDCSVARFGGAGSLLSKEYEALQCVSGIDGPGVDCKR